MPIEKATPRLHAFNYRLRDPEKKEFLHLSGKGTTKAIKWAWIGYLKQAETLEAQAKTRGENWPFQPIARALFEAKPEFHPW